MLSGKLPWSTRVFTDRDVDSFSNQDKLATLPKLFMERGYQTGSIGLTQNSTRFNFDTYEADTDAEVIVRKVFQFLNQARRSENPFFLMIGLQKSEAREDRMRRLSDEYVIEYLDFILGTILKGIIDLGLGHKTVLNVISKSNKHLLLSEDNLMDEHFRTSWLLFDPKFHGVFNTFDLRKKAREEASRAELTLPAKLVSRVVSLVDVLPTVLEASGIPVRIKPCRKWTLTVSNKPCHDGESRYKLANPKLDGSKATGKFLAYSFALRSPDNCRLRCQGVSLRSHRFRYNIWFTCCDYEDADEAVHSQLFDMWSERKEEANVLWRGDLRQMSKTFGQIIKSKMQL